MALGHSPAIVTSGLIYYHDMNNTQKSWLGAPSTNLLPNSDGMNSNWYGYCAGNMNNVTYNTTDVLAPNGTYTALKIVRDSGTSCGGSGAWGMIGVNSSITAGTTYTISIWGMAPTTVSGVGFMFNDAGGTSITLTPTWQRFTYTAALPDPGDGLRGLQYIIPPGSGTCYFWGAQLEQTSFATPYMSTSTGSGTRTTANSVIDLTSNNTLTLNNITYNSDGSFGFNGSNSYISSPTSSLFDVQTVTMECWCNPTTTSQGGFLFEKGNVNTQYSNFFNGDGTFYFRTIGLSSQDLTFASASYITPNQWNHIVCTYGGGVKTIYVNGVQIAQATGLTGSLPTGQNGQWVGMYGPGTGYPFSGKIGVSRVYNTVLNAAQVQQNFNAHRRLYGR